MKKILYIVSIIMLFLLAACDEPTQTPPGESKETSENQNIEQENTSEDSNDEELKEEQVTETLQEVESPVVDEVKKIITKALGKTNNTNKDRIRSVVFSEGDNGIIISLNASENLTTNMTKKGIWMDTKKLFEELHKSTEFDIVLINWYLPLVDQYGNESDSLVMSIDMKKETLEKINWDKFLFNNIPDTADHYHNHPALD